MSITCTRNTSGPGGFPGEEQKIYMTCKLCSREQERRKRKEKGPQQTL